jgi:hypothetical protein
MIVIRFDMMLLPLRLMGADVGGRSRLHPLLSPCIPGAPVSPGKAKRRRASVFPFAAGVDSSTSMPAYERLKEL